ncbi:INTERFERON-INDUCED PROTEIN 44 [Salix viminalis]|uniref:INTERFERON-INDUCED PROTEIN 44 n=1 Tax=Salix viminalis TaxID=40686 RepID=A0A9Q0ZCL3_SALVM|nr:INTERFERON-INDUCED PROTEIN 44 [Salix viminalis]
MDTDCQVLVTVGGDQQQSLMNWLGLSLTSQKLHALIAQEGLDEVRYKLQMYRSGDFWVPTGGIKKGRNGRSTSNHYSPEHGFLAEESDPATAYAVTDAVYRGIAHLRQAAFSTEKTPGLGSVPAFQG